MGAEAEPELRLEAHRREAAGGDEGDRLAPTARRCGWTSPDLAPTWGMEIKYRLKGTDGRAVTGVIHNTIHEFGR